jgi:hypothetical protein
MAVPKKKRYFQQRGNRRNLFIKNILLTKLLLRLRFYNFYFINKKIKSSKNIKNTNTKQFVL